MNISLKTRWEIVFLSKQDYDPHRSNDDISRYLRVDESTVRYWLKRYKTIGDVGVVQKSGRSRSTGEKQDGMIQLILS